MKRDNTGPCFLMYYQITKTAVVQAGDQPEKRGQDKGKRKGPSAQALPVPTKRPKGPDLEKTERSAKKSVGLDEDMTGSRCLSCEERLFVFLSSELNKAYGLFLQNTIPLFEKVNCYLQAQAPQIHVLRSLLLGLFKDIFSKFVKPDLLKECNDLLSVGYKSRNVQKEEKDLIIG